MSYIEDEEGSPDSIGKGVNATCKMLDAGESRECTNAHINVLRKEITDMESKLNDFKIGSLDSSSQVDLITTLMDKRTILTELLDDEICNMTNVELVYCYYVKKEILSRHQVKTLNRRFTIAGCEPSLQNELMFIRGREKGSRMREVIAELEKRKIAIPAEL